MKRTRAPHGKPKHTTKFSVRLTKQIHRMVMDSGGSDWARRVLSSALLKQMTRSK